MPSGIDIEIYRQKERENDRKETEERERVKKEKKKKEKRRIREERKMEKQDRQRREERGERRDTHIFRSGSEPADYVITTDYNRFTAQSTTRGNGLCFDSAYTEHVNFINSCCQDCLLN